MQFAAHASVVRLGTKAPAKINLTLEVLGRRPDGYHAIRSVVIGIGLYDELVAFATISNHLKCYCNIEVIPDEDNLVVKAARSLAETTGQVQGAKIYLEKRIPLAAGMGGGSSDAAATLRLCNELWQTRISPRTLEQLAAQLGSDVPLFFHLPACRMEGRGEIVSPLRLEWQGVVLLVLPALAVCTADVYRVWRDVPVSTRTTCDVARLCSLRCAAELMEMTGNDLTAAAGSVCPALVELADQLKRLRLGHFQMTGSGPTLYRLYDDPEEAQAAAASIERLLQVKTVVVPAPVGSEPIQKEST